MALLDVTDLKTYFKTRAGDARAVDGVSFSIAPGVNFGLLGESGCGKTTAAKSIIRLLPNNGRIAGGKIMFKGRDLTKLSEEQIRKVRWQEISMISQSAMNALDPVYKVGAQIVEAIRAHRDVSKADAMARARELFDLVGVDHRRLEAYPHQFSGGMRQRAIIAMSLALNPSLIIADEPTTALDVTIQAQILSLLVSLQQEFQMSLLLITHDLGVVARVAHRVAVMYCGEVVELGDVGELFANPLHPYTRGLMACIPVPGRTEPGCKLASIPGLVPSPIGHMEGCTYRNRCPDAIEDCAVGDIGLIEVSPGHYIRCRQNGAAVMEATDGLDD